jgi:hypothetical protein
MAWFIFIPIGVYIIISKFNVNADELGTLLINIHF